MKRAEKSTYMQLYQIILRIQLVMSTTRRLNVTFIYFPSQMTIMYSITITSKGIPILYEKIQNAVVVVDLSNNKFKGKIPKALRSLCGLKVLNVSNNNLIGKIPSSLANLAELESLDLPGNLLSGEIPPQLSQLTFLEFLNPLSKSCGNLEASTPPPLSFQGDDSKFPSGIDWIVIFMGYGSGLIVGLVTGHILTTRYHKWFVGTFGRGKQAQRREKRKGRRN
ncbi:hypothetical protein ACSBR1_012065 [Camellia fascicularis]